VASACTLLGTSAWWAGLRLNERHETIRRVSCRAVRQRWAADELELPAPRLWRPALSRPRTYLASVLDNEEAYLWKPCHLWNVRHQARLSWLRTWHIGCSTHRTVQ